jgi:hypothetical protein
MCEILALALKEVMLRLSFFFGVSEIRGDADLPIPRSHFIECA